MSRHSANDFKHEKCHSEALTRAFEVRASELRFSATRHHINVNYEEITPPQDVPKPFILHLSLELP